MAGDVLERGVEGSKHEIRDPIARRVGLPGEPRVAMAAKAPPERLEKLEIRTRDLPEGVEAVEPEEEQGDVLAVLVVHGMGQQVQFETLDQVEVGLRRIEAEKTGIPVERQPRSIARAVLLGDQTFERLEMQLTRDDGRPVWIHLYEAYWAPLTEGKVTLRDVMGLLWDGGLNGLAKSRESFSRFLFGHPVDFGRQRTAFKLLLALGVVAVLMLINALVTAVAAALLASRSSFWTGEALLSDLTLAVAGLVALLLACAVLVWATRKMAFFYLALAAMLAFGAAALVILLWHRLSGLIGVPPWPHPLHGWRGKVAFLVIWLALLKITLKVRTLLIQYVGDVAAYVSPQKLDRFSELRQQIKTVVATTAESVYGALSTDGGRFEYRSVAVVAHSLGSVVAYDTLNALLNKDTLHGGRLAVADRTRLLLTFGSPLEKTAYLFANQSRKTSESREALAAAVQPLIQDYVKFRRFPWVNVFSPKDIISGRLLFYDDKDNPASQDRLVENQEDSQAATPVYAHVQYWKNDLVFQRLHQAL